MWRSTLPGSTLSLKHKQEIGIMPEGIQGTFELQGFTHEDGGRYAGKLGVEGTVVTVGEQLLLRREVHHDFNGDDPIIIDRACDEAGRVIPGTVPYASFTGRQH
jgi:hypothetical protein